MNPLQQVSQEISDIRASKLPDWRVIGTAGSFFKNPVVSEQIFLSLQKRFEEIVGHLVPFSSENMQNEPIYGYKLSAARLIEQAGMKGFTYGKAGVYEQHALVLVNRGGAAEEVLEVMRRVQEAVREKFEIELEPEVVIL